jgi:hypothetical protein
MGDESVRFYGRSRNNISALSAVAENEVTADSFGFRSTRGDSSLIIALMLEFSVMSAQKKLGTARRLRRAARFTQAELARAMRAAV